MLLLLTLIILIFCALLHGEELFGPIKYEIFRAVEKQRPHAGFGFQARAEQNLRLYAIGGSNTLSNKYYRWLSELIVGLNNQSYYNATIGRCGISGASPSKFIGLKYQFEDNDPKLWPNVIMMEFAVNVEEEEYPRVARELYATIRTFLVKYRAVGLPDPDFMMLELLSIQDLLDHGMRKPLEERLAFANNYPYWSRVSGRDRGCRACKEMRNVCEFYGYPIISYRDLVFPAWMRYYLSVNSTFKQTPWLFTDEGTHISDYGGRFLASTLFAPFFRELMKPRKELPSEQRTFYGGVDLRMFPATTWRYQIVKLSTLGEQEVESNTLYDAIRKPMEYIYMPRTRRGPGWYTGNECYGSVDRSAVVQVDFVVPAVCNSLGSCKVSVEFVHYRNRSAVGDVACDLLKLDSTGGSSTLLVKDKGISGTADENGRLTVRHTMPVRSEFNYTVDEGQYSVRCRKLDEKLSCLTSLYVTGMKLL